MDDSTHQSRVIIKSNGCNISSTRGRCIWVYYGMSMIIGGFLIMDGELTPKPQNG